MICATASIYNTLGRVNAPIYMEPLYSALLSSALLLYSCFVYYMYILCIYAQTRQNSRCNLGSLGILPSLYTLPTPSPAKSRDRYGICSRVEYCNSTLYSVLSYL